MKIMHSKIGISIDSSWNYKTGEKYLGKSRVVSSNLKPDNKGQMFSTYDIFS